MASVVKMGFLIAGELSRSTSGRPKALSHLRMCTLGGLRLDDVMPQHIVDDFLFRLDPRQEDAQQEHEIS